MTTVLIVYSTDYGNTKAAAEALAAGVATVPGAAAVVKTADEATVADIVAADALVLGSPVHMDRPTGRSKNSSTRFARACG